MYLLTTNSNGEPGFLFFQTLPETGSEQRDRAELKLAFEKALDDYYTGNIPQIVQTQFEVERC